MVHTFDIVGTSQKSLLRNDLEDMTPNQAALAPLPNASSTLLAENIKQRNA